MLEALDALNTLAREVQTISRATHLLALNASVEATRAGERGGGFAVVAQEVKSLAEQSKQATAQVRAILGEIQKATGAAVMAAEPVVRARAGQVTVAVATVVVFGTLAMLGLADPGWLLLAGIAAAMAVQPADALQQHIHRTQVGDQQVGGCAIFENIRNNGAKGQHA
mgnify:CR=1 FL=1